MPDIFSAKSPKNGSLKNEALSSFMIEPKHVRFETQEQEEKILLLMRRHPITNIGWIVISLLLVVVPTVIAPIVVAMGILPEIPPGYYLIVPLIWYVGTFGYTFTSFLHWYFNVYIVTTRRVVDIDWFSLMYKQLSSTQLEKIQDVTYKQGGVLDSFFDFGDVVIQTAGNEPNFEFDEIPRPETVVRQINSILSEHRGRNNL